MSTTRRACDAFLLPRRRFLQALGLVSAIGRRAVATPRGAVTQVSTPLVDDVVEYRGWIVRASDRARLEAGALQ